MKTGIKRKVVSIIFLLLGVMALSSIWLFFSVKSLSLIVFVLILAVMFFVGGYSVYKGK